MTEEIDDATAQEEMRKRDAKFKSAIARSFKTKKDMLSDAQTWLDGILRENDETRLSIGHKLYAELAGNYAGAMIAVEALNTERNFYRRIVECCVIALSGHEGASEERSIHNRVRFDTVAKRVSKLVSVAEELKWTNPETKIPPRQTPVIVLATVAYGRKKQIMVAWRKSEWEFIEEKEEKGKRKKQFGFLLKTYEWSGINKEHPTATNVKQVHLWRHIPAHV